MPTDASGRYHMNPQMARMHDRAAKPEPAKPEGAAPHEPHGHEVIKIEFHHHPDGGGRLRSVTHRADGSQHEAEHENVHEAADHLADSMADGNQQEQEPDMNGGAMGAEPEDAA